MMWGGVGSGLPRAANWRLLGLGGLRRTQEDSSTSTYLTYFSMYVTYLVNYLILEILGLRGKRDKRKRETETRQPHTLQPFPSAAHKCIYIK